MSLVFDDLMLHGTQGGGARHLAKAAGKTHHTPPHYNHNTT